MHFTLQGNVLPQPPNPPTHPPTHPPTYPPTSLQHAFITKFNEIDAGCYAKSAEELAKEVALHRRQSHLMLDHTHIICKKVGRVGGWVGG